MENTKSLEKYKNAKNALFDETTKGVPIYALITALICLIIPFRSILKVFINLREALNDERRYKKFALSFSSDYDKENPLTKKQGIIRLLKLQIELAR